MITETQAAAAVSGFSAFKGRLLRVMRAHRLFNLCILGYVAVSFITAAWFDAADSISLAIYSGSVGVLYALFFASFFPAHALYVILVKRPAQPARYILGDLKGRYLTAERLVTALPFLVFMPLFISAFTSMKTMIPVMNPYVWDPLFAEWDRVLHGGIDPWRLLYPLLGDPLLTSATNFVYQLWFFVTYAVTLWQAFSLRDPVLRMRFLLTFVLAWVLLGTLAAVLLSSAGPCYYGRVTELADPFVPLMESLRAANESFPVWALAVQERLWQTYESGGYALGSGISAMPSLHVATAFLYALVGWHTHRALGAVLGAFALAILIGSVHLGWHYAIDGYAGIAGIWLIWRGVGWALARQGVSRQA